MREYSKISPKFWIGETGKAIKKQGMEAQIVAMYLLTSPHANMLGLYYCPVVFISHETGLTFEGASKGLKRAKQAGFCMYDDETEMVWVMEMAAYQIADHLSPNDNRVKGVNTEYQNLPENPFLSLFYEKYKDAFCLSECRDSVVNTEAPSKPLLSQEQEQEQEQKQEQEKPSSSEQSSDKAKSKFGNEDDHKTARWMFDRIKTILPNAKEPSWDSWANDVRLMRERDGHDHAAICALFEWANKDSFWSSNILSPGKLREKWDQLSAKRGQPAGASRGIHSFENIDYGQSGSL